MSEQEPLTCECKHTRVEHDVGLTIWAFHRDCGNVNVALWPPQPHEEGHVLEGTPTEGHCPQCGSHCHFLPDGTPVVEWRAKLEWNAQIWLAALEWFAANTSSLPCPAWGGQHPCPEGRPYKPGSRVIDCPRKPHENRAMTCWIKTALAMGMTMIIADSPDLVEAIRAGEEYLAAGRLVSWDEVFGEDPKAALATVRESEPDGPTEAEICNAEPCASCSNVGKGNHGERFRVCGYGALGQAPPSPCPQYVRGPQTTAPPEENPCPSTS